MNDVTHVNITVSPVISITMSFHTRPTQSEKNNKLRLHYSASNDDVYIMHLLKFVAVSFLLKKHQLRTAIMCTCSNATSLSTGRSTRNEIVNEIEVI